MFVCVNCCNSWSGPWYFFWLLHSYCSSCRMLVNCYVVCVLILSSHKSGIGASIMINVHRICYSFLLFLLWHSVVSLGFLVLGDV
jgi:hypothetical protein